VALHYAGADAAAAHGLWLDVGGRRTPWIVGGMAVLARAACWRALATAWMARSPRRHGAGGVLAFLLVGLGVSAGGTSLLVLLAKRWQEGAAPAPPPWCG
jgi:BCD family chlorophyll transporter-like MFS transporter